MISFYLFVILKAMPSWSNSFTTLESPDDFLTISASFGVSDETTSSTRYHYENDQRGDEPFVIIQRTISGSGECHWNGRYWNVPPEHAFICLVPETSSYYFSSEATKPWRFSWLNFYGPLALLLCDALRKARGPVLPLPSRSTAHACFRDLVAGAEARTPQDTSAVSLASFTFLTEWKRLLDQPQGQTSDVIDTVIRICQARFRERLGIKEIADQANLSREHLTRIFSERVGISPARYLRNLRADAAREMRRSTDTSWPETALRCGFPSVKALRHALAE